LPWSWIRGAQYTHVNGLGFGCPNIKAVFRSKY